MVGKEECEKIHFELHYEGVLIVRRGGIFSEMKRDMILIKKKLVDFHFPNYFRNISEDVWRVNMRENRSLCQVTKSEKHAWNTIRIVIFQHLKSLFSRSRWPEISVKMVRWDMAKPRHVFHRIGMISIYRGQQHKRICWFCQGVPLSPLPYLTK